MLSFPPSPSVRIFVGRNPVDLRKGFDGLSGEVNGVVDEDPGSGFWVLYKRLEHGRFKIFDRMTERRGAFELSSTDLALLLDGIDLRGARRRLSHDSIMK